MKNKKRGLISSLISLVFFIIVCGFIVAFLQVNNIKTVGQFIAYTRIKSSELSACLNESVRAETNKCSLNIKVGDYIKTEQEAQEFANKNKIDLESLKESLKINLNKAANEVTNNHPQPAEQVPQGGLKEMGATRLPKDELLSKLDNLNVVDKYQDKPSYSRNNWKHWTFRNRSCFNTREETLANQVIPGTITFLDKDNQATTDVNQACSIKTGQWIDPLSGEVFSEPGKLDVDHIVPLKLAARAGGDKWDKKTKETYANDVDVLIVTSAKQNRSKGAKSPSEWMPPKTEAHCDYAKIYVNVLSKYNLNITNQDKSVLQKALSTCAY